MTYDFGECLQEACIDEMEKYFRRYTFILYFLFSFSLSVYSSQVVESDTVSMTISILMAGFFAISAPIVVGIFSVVIFLDFKHSILYNKSKKSSFRE